MHSRLLAWLLLTILLSEILWLVTSSISFLHQPLLFHLSLSLWEGCYGQGWVDKGSMSPSLKEKKKSCHVMYHLSFSGPEPIPPLPPPHPSSSSHWSWWISLLPFQPSGPWRSSAPPTVVSFPCLPPSSSSCLLSPSPTFPLALSPPAHHLPPPLPRALQGWHAPRVPPFPSHQI